MLACVPVRGFVCDPLLLLLPPFFSLLHLRFPRRVPVPRVDAPRACPSSNSPDVRHDPTLSFTIAGQIGGGSADPSCNGASSRLPTPFHRSSTLSLYDTLLSGACSGLARAVHCVRFFCKRVSTSRRRPICAIRRQVFCSGLVGLVLVWLVSNPFGEPGLCPNDGLANWTGSSIYSKGIPLLLGRSIALELTRRTGV